MEVGGIEPASRTSALMQVKWCLPSSERFFVAPLGASGTLGVRRSESFLRFRVTFGSRGLGIHRSSDPGLAGREFRLLATGTTTRSSGLQTITSPFRHQRMFELSDRTKNLNLGWRWR